MVNYGVPSVGWKKMKRKKQEVRNKEQGTKS